MVCEQELPPRISSRLFDELSRQGREGKHVPVSLLPTKLLFRQRKRKREEERREIILGPRPQAKSIIESTIFNLNFVINESILQSIGYRRRSNG
jgi:hypothetical protein